MPGDPISRLQFARAETDRVFGQGYALAHPEVVASVMTSASLDYAAHHITAALHEIADAVATPGTADHAVGIAKLARHYYAADPIERSDRCIRRPL